MSTDDRRKRGGLARGMLVLFVATLGVFVVAVPVAAQLTTGTISGSVVDAGGLALPGASVTITNTGTGATRTHDDRQQRRLPRDGSLSGAVSRQRDGERLSALPRGGVPAGRGPERACGRAAGGREHLGTGQRRRQLVARRHAVVGRDDRRGSPADAGTADAESQRADARGAGAGDYRCVRPGRRHRSTKRADHQQRGNRRPHEPERHPAGRRDPHDLALQPRLEPAVTRLDPGIPGADQHLQRRVRPGRRDQPPRHHEVGQQHASGAACGSTTATTR